MYNYTIEKIKCGLWVEIGGSDEKTEAFALYHRILVNEKGIIRLIDLQGSVLTTRRM